MHGGEERQGSAGSGLPVLSCERQTFGRVITRRTALGVISDSCLFKVFGAHSLYGLRLLSLRLMFRLHLHQEDSCMCQHKQCAYEAHQECTCLCFTDAQNIFYYNIQVNHCGVSHTIYLLWCRQHCAYVCHIIIILHQIYSLSKHLLRTCFETIKEYLFKSCFFFVFF